MLAIVSTVSLRRARERHEAEIAHYEEELIELRQERADDRETNRRLRRELALNTPGTLQVTREERDRAIDELDKLHTELRQATSELAERDRSLREARLAIHDIRVQLERNRFELDDHGDAGQLGEVAVGGSAGAEPEAADIAPTAASATGEPSGPDGSGDRAEPEPPDLQGEHGERFEEGEPADAGFERVVETVGTDHESRPGEPMLFADYPRGGAAS